MNWPFKCLWNDSCGLGSRIFCSTCTIHRIQMAWLSFCIGKIWQGDCHKFNEHMDCKCYLHGYEDGIKNKNTFLGTERKI